MTLPNLSFWILASLFIIAVTSVILLKSYSEPIILIGLALKGITQGLMMTILLLILMEIPQVGFRYAGSVGGMFFAAAEIGEVLGSLSLGLLSDYDEGFQSGFTMLSLVCIFLCCVIFLLKILLIPQQH